MPKVKYTNSKGLFQESGTGFLPVGGAAGEVLGLGQLRTSVFTIDCRDYLGGDTTFTNHASTADVLQQLGTLDVSVPTGVTATKIMLADVIVNVTEACNETLAANLNLSSDNGIAQNVTIGSNTTEVFGAGATYVNGQAITVGTEADIDLGSAACVHFSPNVIVPIARKELYLLTQTALAATPTAGTANICVKYYVV